MLFKTITAALALAALLPAAQTSAPAKNQGLRDSVNIPLWDAGKVPGATGDGPLDAPFLTAFLPAPGKANGASVIIAPGGSNIMLMYGAEGIDIAERYNEWGVTAFVLTYRLAPRYNDDARTQDGQRAIRLLRARAAEYHLDPNRVGYIGFSAGSNMGRPMVATATPGDPDATDPVQRVSARPDYIGFVYGPGRATPGENLNNFPPVFLLSAAGDRGPSLANTTFAADLIRAGATVELHIYQKGHHGFGDGFASPTYQDWMGRLELFLKQGGFIPGGKQ